MATILSAPVACSACDFTSADLGLIASHSCDVQANGGRCDDFPCCGHEQGDCNGQRYGSDAAIQERYLQQMRDADEYGDLHYYDYD